MIWWPSKEVFVSYRRGDFVWTLDKMKGDILVRFELFEERCELNFKFLLVVSSRRFRCKCGLTSMLPYAPGRHKNFIVNSSVRVLIFGWTYAV